MRKTYCIFLIIIFCWACTRHELKPRFGMYYWRTSLNIGEDEQHWADSMQVKTLYLRLFDVIKGGGELNMRPEATLRFGDIETGRKQLSRFERIVPVVFIAPDAITRNDKDKMPELARLLLNRIDQVTEKNGLGRCDEVQVDFDWAQSNGQVYFSLLKILADTLHSEKRMLSTTIRLHQLSLDAPPVDRGVLMCYNTGKIMSFDETNSILSKSSVEPYLKHLDTYKLPLVLALPDYGWNVVFHNREFSFVAPGLELGDTSMFTRIDETHYRARVYQAVPQAVSATSQSNVRIHPGDVIRREESSPTLNREILQTIFEIRPEITDQVIFYRN